MTWKYIAATALLAFTIHSCNFNKSFKKDIITGAVYVENDLSSDDVVMTINGKQSTNNVYSFGDKIEFTFNNIQGLKRKKGLVYPGMSMYIIKNDIDTILIKDDLFSESNSTGTDLNPLKLMAYFKSPAPNLENETYKVSLKIWDKKGPGTITYEMPFSSKPNDLLSIESNGINYSNIYLWDETKKKIVAENKIDINSEFILILEGLEGLDLIDNIAFPALEIEIIDKNGKSILLNENVLEGALLSGVEKNLLKETKVPVTITFSAGTISNPCQLKATFKDLNNPEKQIIIQTELIIE